MSDQNDPSNQHAEDIHAAAHNGGVAVGAVQVAGDVDKLQIGNTYVSEALTLRATPPAPPPHFTGREDDLAKFTQLLTSGQNVAITALQGMGGIGKTALAQKLAERVRDHFPGGVLWWTLGPSADVFTALDVWARHADPRADLTALPTAEDRAEAVRPMLARLGKLCVIIDDVWDEAAARILMSAIPPGSPILITTRDGDLAKSLRCRVERIDALSDDEAVALLEKLLGPLEIDQHSERSHEAAQSKSAHPSTSLRSAHAMSQPTAGWRAGRDAYSAACDIAHLTEGLPLALELIAGHGRLARRFARPRQRTPHQTHARCAQARHDARAKHRSVLHHELRTPRRGHAAPLPGVGRLRASRRSIAMRLPRCGMRRHDDSVDEAIKFLVRRSLLTRVSF